MPQNVTSSSTKKIIKEIGEEMNKNCGRVERRKYIEYKFCKK